MKIPQQLLAPIVGVLAGCFGIGVGLIIRQPEINELHRQVAKLQKKADELKETGRDFNEAETAFYAAFSKMLDGKELDADQMESVKSYVEATHSAQIEAMTPCDASEPIERIRNFEDGKKERFFHLPQIDLPKFEIPKVEIPLPWKKESEEEHPDK